MSIPRIIHQFWCGDQPPDDIKYFMHTVRVHHPGWSYMLWNEETIPSLGIADNFAKARDRFKNWASFSNYVRLLAVGNFGGVYLDVDVECLRSLEPLLVCNAFAAIQDNEEVNGQRGRICNAIIGAEPRHPWINWQIEHTADFDEHDPASGIYLASAAPREGLTLIDPVLVYPFHWDDPPEKRKPHPDSIAAHWWKGSWRK